MSETRTLTIWESQLDATTIIQNNWNFQIAKSVAAGNGGTTTNVVWKSQGFAPITNVSWDLVYGLNWTASVPARGVTVSVGGNWIQVNKGDSVKLEKSGYWSSTGKGEAGWLNVSSIDYKYPNVPGIHLVVGIKNGSGGYDPIYIDQTSLPPGSNAKYQPQEQVTWWWEAGNYSGAVYSYTGSQGGGQDFTNPAPLTGEYHWWTTYTVKDGSWYNSQTAPPSQLHAPLASEALAAVSSRSQEVLFFPFEYIVGFAIAVVVAEQPAVRDFLTNYLSNLFVNVEIVFTTPSGNELRVSYGPPRNAAPGSFESFAIAAWKADGPVNEALTAAKNKNVLPANETWTISQKNGSAETTA